MADGLRSSWEYKVEAVRIGDAGHGMARLNELGDDGWELVEVAADDNMTAARPTALCIFKRPKGRPTVSVKTTSR